MAGQTVSFLKNGTNEAALGTRERKKDASPLAFLSKAQKEGVSTMRDGWNES